MAPTALKSYLAGRWVEGTGAEAPLLNPATEETVATVRSGGLDLAGALAFAREKGGPALRALTFAQRGALLKKLSASLSAKREELLTIAQLNGGNTRGDAKFDVDGAIATLEAYAELATGLGETKVLTDGESIALGRSAKLGGVHVRVPRQGVAVQVNAFNFPAWGLAEKLACAFAAGMPVLTKPATSTAHVAYRMMELFVESGALPEGSLSFLAGSAGDLLSHLSGQDVLAFTGGSDTAVAMRSAEKVVRENVRVNIEADSLNATVLGPDVEAGSEPFHLFISDVVREMTQKTGQKCTATRRIYVPEALREAVKEALKEKLSAVKVGNPTDEKVTMGPLATAAQLRDVKAGVKRLLGCATLVHGDPDKVEPIGVPAGKGYFLAPLLLECLDPRAGDPVHTYEVFGPVSTLISYDGTAARAAALVAAGGGGLVASVYSDDKVFLREVVLGIGAYSGRVVLGGSKVAGQSLPPGMVLPQLIHGGPGRAGGGEELGGLRGMAFYQQRVALQGYKPLVEQLFG
jgi:oxepin-CoA hydrolase/3-oxo-5,6-dehydrosuberyl-CoA semialdehyde dehydrogenase